MVKLLALLLLVSSLGACSQSGASAGATAKFFPVKIRWTSDSDMAAENLRVKVAVGGHEAWARVVPSQLQSDIGEVLLPCGPTPIHVEVANKAEATMIVTGAPHQEIDLSLFNRNDASSPSRWLLAYQVRDDSQAESIAEKAVPSNESLLSLVPITVDLYDSGGSRGSPERDKPLCIYLDKTLVYDGVARAGNIEGQELVFRVKPGVHVMRFISAGYEKSCEVNAVTPSYVSVYLGKICGISTIVSNNIIPSM